MYVPRGNNVSLGPHSQELRMHDRGGECHKIEESLVKTNSVDKDHIRENLNDQRGNGWRDGSGGLLERLNSKKMAHKRG